MKLCILENDTLEPQIEAVFGGFGSMFVRLLKQVGAEGEFDVFNTTQGQYPISFDLYDAVLLTGSRADSFSQEPWVLTLKRTVQELLVAKKKLLGICFGHQLIALCLGAKVGRAPTGWCTGRLQYQWTGLESLGIHDRSDIALLASHQDQVFELPSGAELLATSAFCPVAAFRVENHVFCVQAHPEFIEDFSAYLLDKRRSILGEEKYRSSTASLVFGHDGEVIAKAMLAFINRR